MVGGWWLVVVDASTRGPGLELGEDPRDLAISVIKCAVRANDAVGSCSLLFDRQLRRHPQSRVLLADAVARHQSSNLGMRIARDHDDLVEVTFSSSFEEQRDISDGE